MGNEEKQRRRMLGRLRGYLARRRSPRAVLSAILVVTALAGFLVSAALLRLGFTTMWQRYPLAVLGAWGVFLLLVRSWAERERAEMQAEKELEELGPKDDVFDGTAGRSVLQDGEPRGGWWDWLDWLNPFELLEAEAGCLVGAAVVVAIIALAGAFVAIAGLIMQAEFVLAEVLLDVLLISALNKRLHRLEPQWWLSGVLRHTRGPVLVTMLFVGVLGFLLQCYAPEAPSIGAVFQYWRGPER